MKPEGNILSKEEFEARVLRLQSAREDKAREINSLLVTVGKFGGFIAFIAGIALVLISCMSFSPNKGEYLASLIISIVVAGSGVMTVIYANLSTTLNKRTVVFGLPTVIYLAVLLLYSPIMYMIGSSSLDFGLKFNIGYTMIVFSCIVAYSSAMVRTVLPGNRIIRVVSTISALIGIACIGISCYLLVEFINKKGRDIHTIGWVLLLLGLLGMVTLGMMNLLSLLSFSRHFKEKEQNFVGVIRKIGVAVMIVVLCLVAIWDYMLLDRWYPEAAIIELLLLPFGIAVAGLIAFFGQAALKSWSAKVDMEITRMRQEIKLLENEEPEQGPVSAP